VRYLIKASIISFIFLAIAGIFDVALAATQPSDPNAFYLDPVNKICEEDIAEKSDTGAKELKFISGIVHCFENVIKSLAIDSMAKVTAGLIQAVNIAMVLYVIIFGARISMGLVSSPRGEVIIHAIKLAFVAWIVNQMGLYELWDMTIATYESILQIMIAPAQIQSCPQNTVSLDYVWETMDCLFAKIIGYNATNGFGSSWQGVALLLSTMVAKASSGGGIGYIIGAFIANALLTVLFSFLQIAMAYIVSLIGLTLLFSIAPLMLPLMFFKYTNQYFEAWYKMIVSFILQVAILIAFLSFAFSIMDEVAEGLKEVFNNTQLSNEVTRTDIVGTHAEYTQKTTAMFTGAMEGKGDSSIMINTISLLVLGYLMISFISVIGDLAKEISGSSVFPNLMTTVKIPIPKI